MIVTCEACATSFILNDELVKPSGSRVRCSKCQHVFRVYQPISEESLLTLPTETSDISLEYSSVPPLFDFSQRTEHDAQKTTLSDHSSETPSFPKEFLDMTEYDFSEIDKLIQSDKLDMSDKDISELNISELDISQKDISELDISDLDISEKDLSENDLLILPGDLSPEPSLSGAEPPVVQDFSDELDKMLEIDLSNLSLDQPEFMDPLDDFGSDLKTRSIPSETDISNLDSDPIDKSFERGFIDISPKEPIQSFENQLDGMNLALDPKIESSDSKPMEVSLDEFEKSLEMNFADISLTSPADAETASDQKMDITETGIDKGQKAKDDLFSEDEFGGFNDIEDMDLSDIETLLEEQDASKFTTSLSDGTENFKRSDSVIVPAFPTTLADETLDMEDQFLTFDELQLDKDESESASLLEVKESFSPNIKTLESPSDASLQKESEIQKTESGDKEKPLSTDTVVEEEPEEDQPAPKKGISPLMIVLLILAVIAGLVYGGYTLLNSNGVTIPFISKPVPSKVEDPGNFKIKPFDISSRFVDNTKIGKLFIITGKVKNEYPAARGSIQVIGKLYTKDKAMSKEATVFCGNILSDIDLANAELAIIQERLQNRSGDNGTNLKVAPGDAIPFMIFFSNLPENLEEFTLEVKASVAI
ncbi:MAG: zinc-ribbon domain-containing protein [Pseudomonadota bacterium]